MENRREGPVSFAWLICTGFLLERMYSRDCLQPAGGCHHQLCVSSRCLADLQQVGRKTRDNLPTSRSLCCAFRRGCQSPPARWCPPQCAKKGHLQPQNRKENKNSLCEHVDGESRQRCEQKRVVTAKADRILMFPSQSQDARIRGNRSSTVCPCFSFFLLNFAGIWESGC